MAGFYIVRVPGIMRVNFRDTYPHYIGPPTVIQSSEIRPHFLGFARDSRRVPRPYFFCFLVSSGMIAVLIFFSVRNQLFVLGGDMS